MFHTKSGRLSARQQVISRDRRRARRGRSTFRALIAEVLERRLPLTTVTGVDPAAGSHDADLLPAISATFDQDVTAATATAGNFVVHGSVTQGQLAGTATSVSAAGPVITSSPTNSFSAGELIQVTATAGISTTGGAANPYVWQFRTASSGSGQFVDGGLIPGVGSTHVSVGDADGDGDLDIVFAGRQLWFNDGSGGFTDSGQNLGTDLGQDGIEFADLDGDGDLDLYQGARVLINDGSGAFTNSGFNFGGGGATAGDLDGDGDLDIMTSVRYQPNRVWINNGSGNFTDSGQALGGPASSDGNAFGDFDNDGDLDAFEIVNGAPNRVWFNDGSGNFMDSGQTLGGFRATKDLDVGDIDGDGDLDVITGNAYNGVQGRVYMNLGGGAFAETGQIISNSNFVYRVRLVDLEGDGDLDFVAFNRNGPLQLWQNDGAGTFSNSGASVPTGGSWGADVGDLDGDGDVDFIEANTGSGGHRIWLHQNLTPSVTLSVDQAQLAEAAGAATITATLSAAHTAPVTIDLGTSGTATAIDDYTLSDTSIVIPIGATSGSMTITAVQDTADEPDETVIVDILNVTNGQEVGTQRVSLTIVDDDEPVMPDVTLSVDNSSIAENGGSAVFTATLSEAAGGNVTVNLTFSGTATTGADYNASGTQIVIASGATSGSITVTAVDDDDDETDETVIVDIDTVSGGNEAGAQQATTTITDDDAPPSFAITDLTPTASGFVAQFSSDLDPLALNLYDTENLARGDADVSLVGAASGPVQGSLIVDATSVTFIKSGGPLAADSYTVTLRSGTDGFQDAGGRLLDGNGDGTGGDDYIGIFDVAAPEDGTITVSIPDFTRGPGQTVNLPADTGSGIPITISDGENVRAIDIRVGYDPAKLNITGATLGADAPAGATVISNTNTPGLAILVFFSSTALSAGSAQVINLQAEAPSENAGDVYGGSQVLDLHGVTISDGNDNEAPVLADDAFQSSIYFGDVSGNGRINAADASQVARFAALIDSGFSGSLLSDPIVVGDVSGNGRINAADASLVARFAALIDVPQIPPVPGGLLNGANVLAIPGPGTLAPPNEASSDRERPEPVAAPELLVPGLLPRVPASSQGADPAEVDNALRDEENFISSLEEAIEALL